MTGTSAVYGKAYMFTSGSKKCLRVKPTGRRRDIMGEIDGEKERESEMTGQRDR